MSEHRFFVHVPLTMLSEVLPRIAGLPLGLELAMDHEALAPEFACEMERLADAIREQGRPCRFHAPFRNLCPAGHDPEMVALTRRRLEATIAWAPRFGARILVVHPAWGPDGDALDVEGFLERSTEFWRGLTPALEAGACLIGLENVFDRDPAALTALLDRLPEERFGAIFDVGHWHAYSRAGMGEWFAAIGGRICGLHLHDNWGVADEHLAVGAGNVPWGEFLRAAEGLKRGLDWVFENRSLADIESGFRFLGSRREIAEFKPLLDLADRIGSLPASGAGAP